MTSTPQALKWSSSFSVASSSHAPNLPGDKILLPPSALEQLLAAAPVVVSETNQSHSFTSTFDPFNPYTFAAERAARAQAQEIQQQLPHPLTFRLVNPDNGNVVYAGIREFSAEDGEAVLSPTLIAALGIDPSKPEGKDAVTSLLDNTDFPKSATQSKVTVHFRELPKGSYVKLRPLEAGYDPEDWKSLLEEYLRSSFTTLTNGEILVVPGGRGASGKREEFRFLVDGFKPEGDGICVVDTDLEVDIEALNEEQARETLKRISEKRQIAPGTSNGNSTGSVLSLLKKEHGQILEDYVDYELPSWDRSQGVDIELDGVDGDADIDLFVSPFSAHQRARPRQDEYVFSDMSGRSSKRIRIQPNNVELDNVDALWISVHASRNDSNNLRHFSIKVAPFDPTKDYDSQTTASANDTKRNPEDEQCKNCLQWVPKGRMILHENFCLRNNIICPHGCGQVFQRRSTEWEQHWHCPHDTFYGEGSRSHEKHDFQYHTEQSCPGCDRAFDSLPLLASHRTSVCPAKLILCQFCHLEVPQEGIPDEVNPEAILSGLTPHELVDGGRTTECHTCNKIVRFRDMRTHLATHELEKRHRPTPRPCRNVMCGRTLDGTSKTGETRSGTRMGNGPGNELDLCSVCFGPLYVTMHDPEGKALKRRVERRYLMQLLTGCGKSWCRNEFCKTGRKNLDNPTTLTTKDALPMIKPFVDGLHAVGVPMHFCADENSQKRRILAGHLTADRDLKGQQYAFEWCIAALEAEGGDLGKAREWLNNWAPVQN